MKIHLFRSERSTWCGRSTLDWHIKTHSTRDRNEVTCKICLRADEAEQRKEKNA